jgi:phosphoribosylglycinamide formyltransferase-1
LDDDTESSLAARVLEQEHRLLPEVIHLIATGQITISGRHVRTKKRG